MAWTTTFTCDGCGARAEMVESDKHKVKSGTVDLNCGFVDGGSFTKQITLCATCSEKNAKRVDKLLEYLVAFLRSV